MKLDQGYSKMDKILEHQGMSALLAHDLEGRLRGEVSPRYSCHVDRRKTFSTTLTIACAAITRVCRA